MEKNIVFNNGLYFPKFIFIGSIWAIIIYISFVVLFAQEIFHADFTTFYRSVDALWNDINPYQVLQFELRGKIKKLPAHLNPPIFLTSFMLLKFFSYKTARTIWYSILLVCAFASFYLAKTYGCSNDFWKRNHIIFKFIYLTSFTTIMGFTIGQLGAFIAFWILLGYHFYHTKAYQRCALCWGYISACKFFPAVLLLFCIQQRKLNLACWYVFYGLMFFLLPAVFWGVGLFYKYINMMASVMWYGDSWNASFFGVIGRLFINNHNTNINLFPYHLIWLLVATPVLLFYLLQRQLDGLYSFILALVLMLLLSPFGWMYYFFLLFIVLLFTSERAEQGNYIWFWFLTFVLMNFPVPYIAELHQKGLVQRLVLCSAHFYGLMALLILLLKTPKGYPPHPFSSIQSPIFLNQALGLSVCTLMIIGDIYKFYYFP